MQQLTQKLKKGDIEIREVPCPILAPGNVLVRNHYSLISAGTEGSTVETARKSLIGKARARPQQARQVLEVLQTQGPVQTYRTVMKKLDAYSPLGYSTAGEVIGVGEGVKGFRVGDRVACAGNSASHAEIVSVPENLAVKLAPGADLRQASYNALGAIAMQGVRRAELSLGAADRERKISVLVGDTLYVEALERPHTPVGLHGDVGRVAQRSRKPIHTLARDLRGEVARAGCGCDWRSCSAIRPDSESTAHSSPQPALE